MQTVCHYSEDQKKRENRVVCIAGKARHGKDTIASMMKGLMEADGYRVLVTHHADLLKYVCRTFFNWDGKKDKEGRRLLQYVGSDVVRKVQPDFWVSFIKSVLSLFPEWDYVLIPDCRFPNEIDQYKEDFDGISIQVKRTGFASPLTKEQQVHISETALDGASFDYVLLNDGTLDDLRLRVQKLWEEIRAR